MSLCNEMIAEALKKIQYNKNINLHQMSKICNVPEDDLKNAIEGKGLSFEHATFIVEKIGVSFEYLSGDETLSSKEYFYPELKDEFIKGLNQILSKEGIKQAKFIEICEEQEEADKISKSTISEAFTGKRISLKTMKKISKIFNVSFDFLFGNTNDYDFRENIFDTIKSHIDIQNINVVQRAINRTEITGELQLSESLFSYFKSMSEANKSEMSDKLKESYKEEAKEKFLRIIKEKSEKIKFDFEN